MQMIFVKPWAERVDLFNECDLNILLPKEVVVDVTKLLPESFMEEAEGREVVWCFSEQDIVGEHRPRIFFRIRED